MTVFYTISSPNECLLKFPLRVRIVNLKEENFYPTFPSTADYETILPFYEVSHEFFVFESEITNI